MLSFIGLDTYPHDHDKKDDLHIVYVVELPSKNIEYRDTEIVYNR